MATYTLDFLFDGNGAPIDLSKLELTKDLRDRLLSWNRDALPILGPGEPDQQVAKRLDIVGSELALEIFESMCRVEGLSSTIWVSYFSLWRFEDIANFIRVESVPRGLF